MKIPLEAVLDDFKASGVDRRWLSASGVKVYLRQGKVLYNRQVVFAITVANVTVGDGRRAKTGKLRPLFAWLERNAPIAVFESVMSDRMRDILVRNGWELIAGDEHIGTYGKRHAIKP